MSKELMEKKNDLITRAEEIINKAKEEKRELTPEEMNVVIEIRDTVKKIADTLKIEDEIHGLAKEDPKPAGGDPNGGAPKEGEQRSEEEAMQVRAFENLIRGRVIHERAGELTPAANSAGVLIPTTIANRIIKKVYDICPVLDRSNRFNVKGKLALPYYDTSSQSITVDYQEEFSAMQSSSGKFVTVTLDGFLCGALSKISKSLINNAQFNIVDFVVNEMATAIKRFIERELLNGTPDKIEGLSGLTNAVTAAAQDAITADEIVKLHDAIKDEYQENACYIMSSATRTALRLLKTSDGKYLLNDDVSTPFGTAILGKPVYVSDNMPEIAAGKTAIYYGDLSGLATKFSEDVSIEVLREKYADEHAVGVVGWFEFDSKVTDNQKLAKLVMASA